MPIISRLHGPILTYGSPAQLADCIRRGQYNAQKVITGWGPPGGWTSDTRRQVVTTPVVGPYPPKTIVRTVAGDGQYGRGFDGELSLDDPRQPYPLPDTIEQEIAPWYELDPKIYIEIGNEPNNEERSDKPWGWWNYYQDALQRRDAVRIKKAEDYVWNWKYWFSQSLQRIRDRFPGTKVISPGLAKPGADVWHRICQDAFSRANFVGAHWFGGESFSEDWGKSIIPILQQHYPTNDWILSEYGLHSQADWIPQRRKGTLYAEFVHFGASDPVLPPNVKGATYFHLDTRAPNGGIEPAYVIYGDVNGRHGGGDDAYRDRKNVAPGPSPGTSDRRGVDERLNRGSALRSLNGRYTLHLQAGDGNLVLYNSAEDAIWASHKPGGDFLVLQADGNLVVYRNNGVAVWASNTVGSGANALVLQDDGNLVLYSPAGPVWATNTVGR